MGTSSTRLDIKAMPGRRLTPMGDNRIGMEDPADRVRSSDLVSVLHEIAAVRAPARIAEAGGARRGSICGWRTSMRTSRGQKAPDQRGSWREAGLIAAEERSPFGGRGQERRG